MSDISTDYSRMAGGAALGARLRRISERIDRETAQLYAAINVRFEQRWFGLLNQLALNGPMTVGAIADALRLSHASVSQARKSLENQGIIHALNDAADARKRPLALTPAGHALVTRLTPLWQALAHSAAELNAEAGNVIAALNRLEDALDRRPLHTRTLPPSTPDNAGK